MFWGRGDTSKLDPAQRELLYNLRRLTETGHIVAMDADDAEIALEGLEVYAQWRSVLRALTSIKNVALLVGAILTVYWAAKGTLAQWIMSLGGAP
jgi:hypothetical protein